MTNNFSLLPDLSGHSMLMMDVVHSRRKANVAPIAVTSRAIRLVTALVTLLAPPLVGILTPAAAQQPRPRAQPAAASSPRTAARAGKPTASYWVYVGAESADLIHRVKFGPDGATVEKTISVGESATEMEGPHGLQISRDGKYLHMTTGHGSPDGKYWRYELGPDTLVGPGVFLGFFPASIDVTPDGMYAFVVNFNLHGGMVPSSVSV
ncbi:MAG: hypothetical protein ACREON_00670, partial [Gemmatimonadaceae bacterium]